MSTGDDGEWRFSLEDIEESQSDEDEAGNVAGTLSRRAPVEPEDIDVENAFFVLVGVLIAGLFVGAVFSLIL